MESRGYEWIPQTLKESNVILAVKSEQWHGWRYNSLRPSWVLFAHEFSTLAHKVYLSQPLGVDRFKLGSIRYTKSSTVFFKCSWLFQVGVGFKSSTSKTRCFTYAFLLISGIEKIIFSVRRAFRPSKKGRSPFFLPGGKHPGWIPFSPFLKLPKKKTPQRITDP